MKEHPILKRVLCLSTGSTRLWRNNVGSLQDKFGRWVKFGIANPGGSDLIGFHSVIITPEMVGRKVAVFTAFEVKQKSGKASAEQLTFIDLVKLKGGIAAVVRSREEAERVLTLWRT